MTLSSQDLALLEAASRALLSPLAAQDSETWLLEAGGLVRDLVGGDAVVLTAPADPSGRHDPTLLYSEDAPDLAAACNAYVTASTAEGMAFTDPFATVWHRMRQVRDLGAYSSDTVAAMAREAGRRVADSPIVGEIVPANGYRDYVGIVKTSALGDATVWVLGRERGGLRFGEHARSVLQTLVPAFRAGLDALGRVGAHRAALDALDEPLAAFSPDGRELHRNPALVRLLEGDPEGPSVDGALVRLGRRAGRLVWVSAGGALAVPELEVQTARDRYTLRVTALPPGLFGPDPAVLVTAAAAAAPAPPTPAAVRERHGLTRREGEVAVLLAEGLRNAEIADRLFVSPHTVRHHVENVLAKLEAPNRAAVAARLRAA